MTQRSMIFAATGALALALVLGAAPASALGLKDCSDKYSAEKTKGSDLGKKNWADYRKAECGPNAKPLAAAAGATGAAPAAAATSPATAPAVKTPPAATATTPSTATPTAPAAKGKKAKVAEAKPTGPVQPAVFPKAVADTYKAKKAGKARLATCLDQYKANKATNANGGLKWIQKGGGYYSQCNKALKAAKA